LYVFPCQDLVKATKAQEAVIKQQAAGAIVVAASEAQRRASAVLARAAKAKWLEQVVVAAVEARVSVRVHNAPSPLACNLM
jgi:hypothetical protein